MVRVLLILIFSLTWGVSISQEKEVITEKQVKRFKYEASKRFDKDQKRMKASTILELLEEIGDGKHTKSRKDNDVKPNGKNKEPGITGELPEKENPNNAIEEETNKLGRRGNGMPQDSPDSGNTTEKDKELPVSHNTDSDERIDTDTTTQSVPSSKSTSTTHTKVPANSKKAIQSKTTDEYIPPKYFSSSSNVKSDSVSKDLNHYGIRIGTWANVELQREVSSSDPADIEFYLLSPLVGDKQTLPANTKLFAKKSVNKNTLRVEFFISHGIMPNGQEFSLSATVYDVNDKSGLTGIVIRSRNKEIQASATDTALSLGGEIVSRGLGDSIAGEGVEKITRDALNREKKHIPESKSYVQVKPQKAKIRIDKSF